MGTTTEQPVGEIRPGAHGVFCFSTAAEQAQVIGSFLHNGLDAREKVIYLSDLCPGQLPGLHGRPDVDRRARSGQLQILPRDTACLTRGRFDPERLLTVVGKQINLAGEQGYAAVRLTADMSWVLNQPGGYSLLMASEVGFDEAIAPDTPAMAICQLDRTRCPPEQLSALQDVHPIRVTADPEFDDGVLRITRTHDPGGLRLTGELDAARHSPFMAALTSIGDGFPEIHLDFTHVRFLDLGTLGLLVTHAMHQPPGHALVLDNLPPEAAGVIETLGWHHLPGLTHGRSRQS